MEARQLVASWAFNLTGPEFIEACVSTHAKWSRLSHTLVARADLAVIRDEAATPSRYVAAKALITYHLYVIGYITQLAREYLLVFHNRIRRHQEDFSSDSDVSFD